MWEVKDGLRPYLLSFGSTDRNHHARDGGTLVSAGSASRTYAHQMGRPLQLTALILPVSSSVKENRGDSAGKENSRNGILIDAERYMSMKKILLIGHLFVLLFLCCQFALATGTPTGCMCEVYKRHIPSPQCYNETGYSDCANATYLKADATLRTDGCEAWPPLNSCPHSSQSHCDVTDGYHRDILLDATMCVCKSQNGDPDPLELMKQRDKKIVARLRAVDEKYEAFKMAWDQGVKTDGQMPDGKYSARCGGGAYIPHWLKTEDV